LTYRCVGCGRPIPWDGRGLFAYTCPCGANAFADEEGNIVWPLSLHMALAEGREPPHIDHYVGRSNRVSELKERAIAFLRSKGARWSWECPECRGKVVERAAMEVLHGFVSLDGLHPELRRLVEEVARA
jgi:DNA-directed RNA polymerase subunit RPC12/RpoP